MKSQDITAIASSTIAINLILGSVLYFHQEAEKKLFREERIEQMQLKKKDKIKINKEKAWYENYKKVKDKEGLEMIYRKYKKDIETCKKSFDEVEKYFKCMTEKGYRENFLRNSDYK